MAIVGISGRSLSRWQHGPPVHSLLDPSLPVHVSETERAALPLTGLVIVLLACAWADAGEQGSPAPPAKSKAPATSEKPKYLLFWIPLRKQGNWPSGSA